MIIVPIECPKCHKIMNIYFKWRLIPYHFCSCGYMVSHKKYMDEKIKRFKEILEQED